MDPLGNEGHRLHTFDSSRFGFQNYDDATDCDDDDDGDIDNYAHLVQAGTNVKSIYFN